MIKYRTRIVESRSHGSRGHSFMLKTIGGGPTLPPVVTCTPTAWAVYRPGPSISDGPQMRNMIEQRALLEVSVNDGAFTVVDIPSPEHLTVFLLTGQLDFIKPVIDEIPKETVVTLLTPDMYKQAYFTPYMIDIPYNPDITEEDLNAFIGRMSDFAMDVFGINPESEDFDQYSVPFVPYSSDGAIVGRTKRWKVQDLYGNMLPYIALGYTTDPHPSEFKLRRGTTMNDIYDAIIPFAPSDTHTSMSCAVASKPLPEMMCIPSTHTFTPTINPANQSCDAFLLSITYFESNYEDYENTIVVAVNTITNSDGMGEWIDIDGDISIDQVTLIDANATPLEVFLKFHDFDKVPGAIGFGSGYTSFDAMLRVNEQTSEVTIAGMFDPAAVFDNMPSEMMQRRYYNYTVIEANEENDKVVNSSNTSIRFNMIDPAILPDGVKCYTTEQFGQEITVVSCLQMESYFNMPA